MVRAMGTSTQKFETLVDLFEKSCQSFATRELFGTKKNGTWTWITYADIKRMVDQARAGLSTLGVGRGDRVAIISNNRVEWAVLAYATYSLGAAWVPMYEAQHEEEWHFIVSDCGAKVLWAANRGIYDKIKGFPETIETLKHAMCLVGDESDPSSYAHMMKAGQGKSVEAVHPAVSDTSNFIYTSGTTGKPKGVILSHGNIASNVSAIHEFFPITPDDRTLSFLPWAHSFGHTCELHGMLSMGASMAINSDVSKLVDEMPEVRPTILMAVPRIFNRIYDGTHKKIAAEKPIIQKLFKDGAKAANRVRDGQPIGLLDRAKLFVANKVIFAKTRARFGGRLKYAMSGGAALSKDVANLIDAMGIMVFEGYGLTETSPIATVNYPNNRKIGSVGKPIPGVTVEIDSSVLDKDDVDKRTGPVQGEIVIQGPNIMQGYHNRPEENAAVLFEDKPYAKFRTGDMGYIDSDGYVWITGRIKEQYKLTNGKYVVPAPLEEDLKLSPFILNVMIHGANKPFNVALIVADPDALKGFAQENGLSGTPDELIKNEKVRAKFKAEIDKYSEHHKKFDRVEKFALITEDWTQQNDMLTPSLKLKRRNVLKKWGDLIEQLYG